MHKALRLGALLLVLAGSASAQSSGRVSTPAADVPTDSLVLPAKIGGVAVRWISATEVVRLSYDSLWTDSSQDSERIPSAPVKEMPQVLRWANPEYPAAAMLKGLEAKLWVVALVDVDGTVLGARIGKRPKHDLRVGFERSALVSAMQNLYQPAKGEGEPTKVWVTYPVQFTPRARR